MLLRYFGKLKGGAENARRDIGVPKVQKTVGQDKAALYEVLVSFTT